MVNKQQVFKALKIIFFIFQIVLALLAILLIAAGSYALSGGESIGLRFQLPVTPSVLILVSGIILLGIVVIGIVALLKNHAKLFVVYFILMLLIFLLVLASTIVVGGFYPVLVPLLSDGWSTTTNQTIRNLQVQFRCCGFYNVTDRPQLPCPVFTTNGCLTAVFNYFGSRIAFVIAITVLFLVLQVACLVLVCVLRTGSIAQAGTGAQYGTSVSANDLDVEDQDTKL